MSVVKFEGERAASEDEIKTVLAHQEETRKILEIKLKGDEEAAYSFGNKEPEPAPAPQIEPQLKPYNVAPQDGATQDGAQPAEKPQIVEPDHSLDELIGDI